MALTNAERQKRYRERNIKPEQFNLDSVILTRLQTYLHPYAAANLERLCKSDPTRSKREWVEMAINSLAERLDCNHDKY